MSIFGKIKDAIFGRAAAAEPSDAAASSGTTATSSLRTAASAPAASGSGASAPAGSASRSAVAAGSVDVAAILDKAVAAKGQKLEWRTSIVDLMKALDLDSSLAARKELAADLNYTGDTSDTATMNVWLHKQVMIKLAENGGKVPDSLRA